MAIGTPYTIVSGGQAPGTSTVLQVTVVATSAAGDAIVVAAGSDSGAETVVSVTDSKSNTYVLAASDYVQSTGIAAYVALNAKALASGTDWIKATFSASAGAHTLNGLGCSGIAATGAVDQTASNDASTGTAMSVGPAASLDQASELAVAFSICGHAGGTPSGWTNGFTDLNGTNVANNQDQECAYKVLSSTTAVSTGAAITSTHWAMLLVTLDAALVPAYPLKGPVRAPLPPRHPRAGRTAGSKGAPVNNTRPPSGPRVYPLHQPVRFHPVRPPRGRTAGGKGAPRSNPTAGPPVRPLSHPVRAPIAPTFSHGRCRLASATSAPANATAGPKIYPQTRPARAPVPRRSTGGRVRRGAGAPASFAQAQFGGVPGTGAPGAFVPGLPLLPQAAPPGFATTGPVLYPLDGPVRAPIPRRRAGGRVQRNTGAPVHNPPPGTSGGDLFLLFPP